MSNWYMSKSFISLDSSVDFEVADPVSSATAGTLVASESGVSSDPVRFLGLDTAGAADTTAAAEATRRIFE